MQDMFEFGLEPSTVSESSVRRVRDATVMVIRRMNREQVENLLAQSEGAVTDLV